MILKKPGRAHTRFLHPNFGLKPGFPTFCFYLTKVFWCSWCHPPKDSFGNCWCCWFCCWCSFGDFLIYCLIFYYYFFYCFLFFHYFSLFFIIFSLFLFIFVFAFVFVFDFVDVGVALEFFVIHDFEKTWARTRFLHPNFCLKPGFPTFCFYLTKVFWC